MRTRRVKSLGIVLCLAVSVGYSSKGFAQVTLPAPQDADALFQAQKWAKAAKAYESVTQSEPANGKAWYRLGASLLALSEYDRAAAALRKAVTISNRAEPMYALAQTYAMLNDNEKAFQWLEKALEAKLPQASRIESEPNLASLHSDPRFPSVLELTRKLFHPCAYQPEYKQFDFWIGEWVVISDGQKVGASSIQRIVENCIIYENYIEVDGFIGKSFNFYDANLHKWRQTWVDGTGRASEFSGEYKDGAMRFEGESHLSDGTKLLRRLTLFNVSPTQVRQLSHVSVDGGKTWSVNYDYIYTRQW